VRIGVHPWLKTDSVAAPLLQVFRVFRGKKMSASSHDSGGLWNHEGLWREKDRKFLAALACVPAIEVKPLMGMSPWISC
jgi:hypothetical protein